MPAGGPTPGIFFTPEENRIGNWQHMITVVLPEGKDWREVLPQVNDWRDWVKAGAVVS